MVVGKSPDWLPPGFIVKVINKNGRKIKTYINVAKGVKYYSKPEVMRAIGDYGVNVTPQKESGDENGLSIDNEVENYGVIVTPQKENGDDNGLSIDNKVENYGVIVTPQKDNGDENCLSIDNNVDVISINANGSPAWLPNGWEVEQRTRHSGSLKGSVYKVYRELSSGKKFYSKAAVARYMNKSDHANTMTVQNKIDNVDTTNVLELNTNEPIVDEPSTVTSLQLVPMANTGNISNVDNKPNVDEPSTVMSPQLVSMTKTGGIDKRKRKSSSFTTVATERSTDDDLPPGWIKEIKISKSGNKMRRDPFYTDPVSGYIFRSKKDALRYLETKDIKECACRPLKMEVDDTKLTECEIPSSSPANEKLLEHKRLGGELNGAAGEAPSGTVESETNISKQKQVHFESDNVKVEDKLLSENSEKNAEIVNTPGPESENRARRNSTKSKKRKGLSLPSRTSKRLSGSQPEISPIVNLSEHSLRAAAKSSAKKPSSTLEEASASVSLPPSDIEQSKAVPEEETYKGDGNHQDHVRIIVENLFNDVEEPPTEGPPEVQSGGEKQIDETETTQEPPLCYDFGDSWSDPLEFAFKTLMSDISIDEFPSCFSDQQNIPPQNQARGPQNEFAARADSSDQVGPSSSSPSPLGDIGFAGSFGGLNRQSSNEVGKKDFQNKFNP